MMLLQSCIDFGAGSVEPVMAVVSSDILATTHGHNEWAKAVGGKLGYQTQKRTSETYLAWVSTDCSGRTGLVQVTMHGRNREPALPAWQGTTCRLLQRRRRAETGVCDHVVHSQSGDLKRRFRVCFVSATACDEADAHRLQCGTDGARSTIGYHSTTTVTQIVSAWHAMAARWSQATDALRARTRRRTVSTTGAQCMLFASALWLRVPVRRICWRSFQQDISDTCTHKTLKHGTVAKVVPCIRQHHSSGRQHCPAIRMQALRNPRANVKAAPCRRRLVAAKVAAAEPSLKTEESEKVRALPCCFVP